MRTTQSSNDLTRWHHSPTDLHASSNSGCSKGTLSATDRGARYIKPFLCFYRKFTLLKPGISLILNNTYHLNLRPGTEILEKAGGAHAFQGWRRNMLTV